MCSDLGARGPGANLSQVDPHFNSGFDGFREGLRPKDCTDPYFNFFKILAGNHKILYIEPQRSVRTFLKTPEEMFFLWKIHFYFVFFRTEKLNTGISSFLMQILKARSQQVLVLTMLLLACSAVSALAQDAGMSDLEILDSRENSEAEKVVFLPGEEIKYIPQTSGTSVAKDSLALQMHDFPMQRAAQRPAERSAEKQSAKSKDDSILTFNFLYYIIQKYKLQDIID
jgi:hypothetical protein